MLRNISRATSYAFLLVVLIFSMIFAGWTRADASSNPLSLSKSEATSTIDKKMGNLSTEENQGLKTPMDELTMNDIFGDEQIFPWEPGLGNHAGAVRGIVGGIGTY